MVFDPSSIRLLLHHIPGGDRNNSYKPYLAIFQTEICNTSHGCRLALGEFFVHGIDAICNVIVSIGEKLISVPQISTFAILNKALLYLRRLTSVNWSRADFESLRAFSASFSVSASLASTSSSL